MRFSTLIAIAAFTLLAGNAPAGAQGSQQDQAQPQGKSSARPTAWQAVVVDGLRRDGVSDALAGDFALALSRMGFGLSATRGDVPAITEAVKRLIATGSPPGQILVIARGGRSAPALDAASGLRLAALNLVLIDGCDGLRTRAAALPQAHILAVATGNQPGGDLCGLTVNAETGRAPIEGVRLPDIGAAASPKERNQADALARAIGGWVAPPQFPDDTN